MMSTDIDKKHIYIIYTYHRPVKNSMGVFDHWYFVDPHLQIEIHPGDYTPNTHLPEGKTKYAHKCGEISLCYNCYQQFHDIYLQVAKDAFCFPWINCETLFNFYFATMVPISFQLVLSITAFTVLLISLLTFSLLSFVIFLLLVILMLLNNRYNYIRFRHYCCPCLRTL